MLFLKYLSVSVCVCVVFTCKRVQNVTLSNLLNPMKRAYGIALDCSSRRAVGAGVLGSVISLFYSVEDVCLHEQTSKKKLALVYWYL